MKELVARCLTTSSKKLLVSSASLLVNKGITTYERDSYLPLFFCWTPKNEPLTAEFEAFAGRPHLRKMSAAHSE